MGEDLQKLVDLRFFENGILKALVRVQQRGYQVDLRCEQLVSLADGDGCFAFLLVRGQLLLLLVAVECDFNLLKDLPMDKLLEKA